MELYFNGRNLLIIVGYYLIINLILYFTMVIDKKRAIKDGWRIPEKNLFLLAVLGGGIGAVIYLIGPFTVWLLLHRSWNLLR